MYPIFFSVASEDVAFSERVWDQFPDDWIYLYSRSGIEGEHFWERIANDEIPKSKIFVVFWSENYVKKPSCIRELEQASELVRQGYLKPLVFRLDNTPIKQAGDCSDEQAKVFRLMDNLIEDHNTSSLCVNEGRAVEILARLAEPILQPQHPMIPRSDLQQALRRAIQKERFTVYPSVWVSGYNGVGRETIIREFNRSFTPSGRGILVDVNEASIPLQVLLRIESEAFGATPDRLRELAGLGAAAGPQDVAKAVQNVFDRGDYIIMRHNRIVEESVELPEWLDEVVNSLTPAMRCKLFIISQIPCLPARVLRCNTAMVAQRVPTLDEQQMTQFCLQLVGHFDRNPDRWTDDDIAQTVSASGGTVGFLVALVRSASRLAELDQLSSLIVADSVRMAEAITVYVRWAFRQLDEDADAQKTLLFIENVTPCHIDDLEKAVAADRPMLRILERLMALGLIERELDSVYRLTPLLATRLNRDLIKSDLLQWLEGAMKAFAARAVEVSVDADEDGHQYLRIEARIQAALIADSQSLPNSLAMFVSAAHWFHAGIRLYHRGRHADAYRLLKRAYDKRVEFSNTSRTELVRYFCLSATRCGKFAESEAAIQPLESVYTTKSIAAFLRADMHEYKREFYDAIKWYESALNLNTGKDSRLERTYRPLINCILRTSKPDYQKAERYALDNKELKKTVFSLMSLVRVYLHWKFRAPAMGRDVPTNIDQLIRDSLYDLEIHPGSGSTYFEMRSEFAEFANDFDGAISLLDSAIALDPRIQLKSKRWRLMVKSNNNLLAAQVIEELNGAKRNPDLLSNWQNQLPKLADIYVRALRASGQSQGKLNQFASELTSSEIAQIVGKSKKDFDRFDQW
jgi:tetratricopeptide (TPR) repeat protein